MLLVFWHLALTWNKETRTAPLPRGHAARAACGVPGNRAITRDVGSALCHGLSNISCTCPFILLQPVPLDTAKAFPNPPAPQQADQTPPPDQGLILGAGARSALRKAHFPVSKFPFYSTKKNTHFFFLWFVVFFSFSFFSHIPDYTLPNKCETLRGEPRWQSGWNLPRAMQNQRLNYLKAACGREASEEGWKGENKHQGVWRINNQF